MVRWSWVNFQCRGVLLVWIRAGQGPTALAVGAGGGCLDIFTLLCPFSSLSPSLWETTRYRLKYCLKGSLSPKTTNQQPTNYLAGWGLTLFCFLAHRVPTGGVLLLQCFIRVADAQGISRRLNALKLSSLHPCFIKVFHRF